MWGYRLKKGASIPTSIYDYLTIVVDKRQRQSSNLDKATIKGDTSTTKTTV
jgi:hypothetical protein